MLLCLFNSIDAALIHIFVQAPDALEDVVVIVDVVLIQFFQAQDVLEDVIVIVAVVHINKEFFFGFIILFTFQAQDALEEEERRTFRKEQRTNILQGQVGIPLCYISFY